MAKRYFELVQTFPLRPIQTEAMLDKASDVAWRLAVKKTRTRDEADYLHVLSNLIEEYEDRHHPIEPLPEPELLQALIVESGKTQRQIAEELGIANSTLSAVLRGKRRLTRQQIAAICRYFQISPAMFYAEALASMP